MWNHQINRVVIAVLSFAAGMGICWAVVFIFIVTPLREKTEDNRVFLIESDLRMVDELGIIQPEAAMKRWQARLTLHAKALQGPLQHHPGAEYFLWWIKETCRTSSSLGTSELVHLLADVPEEKPLPPRIYWQQAEEY
jgi:hypothetical protein